MTERDMTKDTDLPEDFDHYEYYRYISGGDEPDVGIRDLIDKNGLRMGSHTINPETGRSRISSGWVSGVRNGPFFEESTEEEFNRLNAERMEWVRKQKRQKPEADGGPL